LEEIDEQNWDYAHRLFQCVAAASRPLRAEELAEFLAFDFDAGSTPTLLADWRSEDPENEVLSICSTLLVVVKPGSGSPVIQFAHFSVKEYLTSTRLAKTKDAISRFHISMTPAHTLVAQACLGILLHLDEDITKDGLKDFPLAEYAAEHWVGHAQFENLSAKVQDAMKRLFDPSEWHLPVWVWIYDREEPWRRSMRSESPNEARATPLHYAAAYNMHDIATFLIVERLQDVNAWGFDTEETPLHLSSRRGHVEIARLLLEHGADANALDVKNRTPLHSVSGLGRVGAARVLLEHGVDAKARDANNATPLHLASNPEYLREGHLDVVRLLLQYGSDIHARDDEGWTSFMRATAYGYDKMMELLLERGAEDHRDGV
jgi:hypothetical protein